MLSALFQLCHLIQQPCDIDTIIIFILQIRKLRFSEANYLVQGLMNRVRVQPWGLIQRPQLLSGEQNKKFPWNVNSLLKKNKTLNLANPFSTKTIVN